MSILPKDEPKNSSSDLPSNVARPVLTKDYISDQNSDNWIQMLKEEKKPFTLDLLQHVCSKVVEEHFSKKPNVIQVESPVTVVGDIHGQYYDLLKLFDEADPKNEKSFLFLGDYVDRGRFSVLTMTLLIVLKLKYPSRFTILRGNHEARKVIVSKSTFAWECEAIYGDVRAYNTFCWLFKHLPLAAIVDNKYFCVHGGIPPNLSHWEELQDFSRLIELVDKDDITMYSLLWSDPQDPVYYMRRSRSRGYPWDLSNTNTFINDNKFSRIIRAHEFKIEGYGFTHDNQVLTIFSAPNYCGNRMNEGAWLEIEPNSTKIIKFQHLEENQRALNPFMEDCPEHRFKGKVMLQLSLSCNER